MDPFSSGLIVGLLLDVFGLGFAIGHALASRAS